MDRGKLNKKNFVNSKLHWNAANDRPVEVKKCLEDGENPYRPNSDGLSPMHAAVAHNALHAARLLLDQYVSDLAIVREHMRDRFLWKVENNCATKRPILIAWSTEECNQVQQLASSCPTAIPFNVQVFVLLRFPLHGSRVYALDVTCVEKRSSIMSLINRLLDNGVLSFDKSDLRNDRLTYLQTACLYGHKNMIELLIAHGSQLSATGDGGGIPLMTACSTLKKNIIELLLTKYGNRFDPTVKDNQGRNAFHICLQKSNPGLVDYVLKEMIKYRTVAHGESESEAFNRIFPYEYFEYSYTSTWAFVRPPLKALCSNYVVQYRLNLTLKTGEVLAITDLLSRKVALDYCYEHIRLNPEILPLETCDRQNVLQHLFQHDQLEFIKELYINDPAVKTVFHTKGAFELLREALANRNITRLRFLLEHHADYLRSDPDALEEHAIGQTWFDRYYELKKNFDTTVATLKSEGQLLQDIRDEKNKNLLHQAVEWDDTNLIQLLLDGEFDLNRKDCDGNLPIFFVRSWPAFEMMYAKFPVDPTIANETGYNLLHHSCKVGSCNGEKILTKLLELGFDINQRTCDGNVPLSLASCCSVVRFLLQHDAKIELIDGDALAKTLHTKLHCAAWAILPKIAQLEWFGKMAHVYLPWMLGNQNRDFFTCSCGRNLEKHPEIRKTLFDSLYRHSPDKAAEFFREVSHRAINCCARWMLDYGYEIDLELRDQYGYTPLLGLLAYMEEENLDVVERLLRKGVNVNARDNRGRNALLAITSHFRSAQWYGHSLKTIELLLDYGADINAQDENGNTAMHHAFEETQLELAALLVARGADTKLLAVLITSTRGCELDQTQHGCRIDNGQCTCAFGCKSEFRYATKKECQDALKVRNQSEAYHSDAKLWSSLTVIELYYFEFQGRSSDICNRQPCMHGGACTQVSTMPQYKCRCEGTGYWGPRCNFLPMDQRIIE
uniref:EGF-like domain-containing protein n=1 Tax=Anopheles farauti TaxID=69004 RepID=A0A182QYN4_9DIPT